VAVAVAESPAVDYATPEGYATATVAPPTKAIKVPEYRSIVAGAQVLNILSLLFLLGAALTMLFGIYVVCDASSTRSIGLAAPVILVPAIISSLAQLAVGLLIRLLAAVSLAIRDIAQNSFRTLR
jgi:hypothetical protein